MVPLAPLFVFDTETDRILPGLLAPPVVCVTSISDPYGRVPETAEDTTYAALDVVRFDGLTRVREALLDEDVLLVGLNIAFDFAVLCAHEPDLIGPVFAAYAAGRVRDVRIREKLQALALGQFERRSRTPGAFSMAGIFAHRFKIDLHAAKDGPDAWRLRYGELIDVPAVQWPQDAAAYTLGDACKTHMLYRAQERDLYTGIVDTGLHTNEREKAATAWAGHLASCWGVRTDPVAVYALRDRLDARIKVVTDALTDAGLFRAKDGSKDMKVLRGWVSDAYHGKPPETEKGAVATDKTTLLGGSPAHQPTVLLDHKPVPVLQALASISADQHNVDTYIHGGKDGPGPLLSGLSLPVTGGYNEMVESGRTSSFRPNWQNMPRKGGYRECVVPRPGHVFINADYSTIELCALAQVCLDLFGYSAMAEALKAGKDLHLDMAAEMLGISYEEAIRRKAEPLLKEKRQMAKVLNFGFPGGLGAATMIVWAWDVYGVRFAEDPHDAEEVCRRYKRDWLRKWPEMAQFFRYVSDAVESGGGSVQFVQPRSGRVRGGCGYCDGCNTHFQGLAADGATAAWFLLQQECYTGYSELWPEDGREHSPLLGSRMTLFIHDEFVGEAPEAVASRAADRLSAVMVAAMRKYLPDIPIKCDPVLMRRWYKDAEPVREHGGLVCWEPALAGVP